MKPILKRLIIAVVALSPLTFIAFTISVALLYKEYIVENPGEHLKRDYIMKVISAESPVYFRDGETVIGAFFAEEHRQYTPIEKVPKLFKQAIIAAEDKEFYSHPGFSIKGILYAIYKNILAFRVVAGGSTITQQTAKNIYYRKERTLVAKWREFLNALRLEAHYTKDEILEFYINQFHVNANGRGLAIAARYFFDKEVSDLNLIECAFLAGSVKGPSLYNPFVGDKKRKESAKKRAQERVAYVLGEMRKMGAISDAEFERTLNRQIPFKQGRFRYKQNNILDFLRNIMVEGGFEELLKVEDIDNPATAGLKIITTIDAGIQQAAHYSIRHNLSELGGMLEDAEALLERELSTTQTSQATRGLKEKEFYTGVITEPPSAQNGFVTTCEVDGQVVKLKKEALTRLSRIIAGSISRRSTQPDSELLPLVEKLKKDNTVYLSINRIEDGVAYGDFELRPQLESGAVVMRDGEILALVGGRENIGYNRAYQAKRQFGSTFKPFILYLALTLGWSNLDVVSNVRAAFPYQRTVYFPRPDHFGAPDEVSLEWLVVKSENLAAVNLLYRLTDKLNETQFAELARWTGLARQEGESLNDYTRRIRDKEGILSTEGEIKRGLYRLAKEDAAVDLVFEGNNEAARLKEIHYGLYFDNFKKELAGQKLSQKEKEIRERLLDMNFLELSSAKEGLKRDFEEIKKCINLSDKPISRELLQKFGLDENGRMAYLSFGKEKFKPVTAETLKERIISLPVPDAFINNVMIKGLLSFNTIERIERDIEERYSKLKNAHPYSDDVLYLLDDFRILVGIRYAQIVAKRFGVQSELRPVLSIPLGSSEINLMDAALIYQAIASGRTYEFNFPQKDILPAAMILSIEDADGNILYQMNREEKKVGDEKIAALIAEALAKVVEYGTARQAYKYAPFTIKEGEKLKRLSYFLPLMGKTGTTNNYTNAAFFGVIPVPQTYSGGGKSYDLFVITTYTGYDDNRTMRTRRGRVYAGATGALPMFMDIARGIEERFSYGGYLDEKDAAFFPEGGVIAIPFDEELRRVKISPITGKPISGEDESDFAVTLTYKNDQPLFILPD